MIIITITILARETMYLFQRVSLAVQRCNSVAFKGTFTVPTELKMKKSSRQRVRSTFADMNYGLSESWPYQDRLLWHRCPLGHRKWKWSIGVIAEEWGDCIACCM